jgi:hypothetical protein
VISSACAATVAAVARTVSSACSAKRMGLNLREVGHVGGSCVLDLHEVVDDPRLAPYLGHNPAGLQVITAAGPATTAAGRNHFVCGIRRRKTDDSADHAANRNSAVPRPTMMSQHRCTMLV